MCMKSFSELAGREKTGEVLRWFAVLPAAMLSRFTVLMIGSGLKSFTAMVPALASLVREMPVAAAIVFVGSQVAPRFRVATAWFLAAIWVVISVISHLIAPTTLGLWNWLDAVFAITGATGAAAFVHFQVSRKSQAGSQ